MITPGKRLRFMLVAAGLLLLIPFVAMQFTREVQWTPADFAVAGLLLTGTALLCEWVMRRFRKRVIRIAVCALVLLVLVLIWLELAVGILGSPFAGS